MSKDSEPSNRHAPHTEEQIRSHTIGELQPLFGGILIVDYDPLWPELFRREAVIEEIIGRARLDGK